MNSNTNQDKKAISTFDLADFLNKIQDAIKEGYQVNNKVMEGYHFSSMGFYSVTLLKDSKPEVVKTQEPVEPVVENTQTVKDPQDLAQPDAQEPVKEPAPEAKKPRKGKAE